MQAHLEKPFSELGQQQLAKIWQAVHGAFVPKNVVEIFDVLVPEGVMPTSWPSFIGDDHTPYEFSLLVGENEVELRVMAEVLPKGEVTLRRTVEAGRAALRTLVKGHGASLERLDAVSDLFLPNNLDDTKAPFALWLAAGFDHKGEASFKIYLNPLIRGRRESAWVVEEMLQRLGFAGAWTTVTRAMPRGPDADELRFVSLDLSSDERARVKVYGFHHDATPEYLEHVAGFAKGHQVGRVAAFAKVASGGDGALLAARQPATCLSFVAGEATPRTVTVHVPIRAFAGSDAVAHQRVLTCMREHGVGVAPYERAVAALLQRPLDSSSGVIAWAALRTGSTPPKMNVYLAPSVLTTAATKATQEPALDATSPVAVVRRAELETITIHPFFQRLARGKPDIRVVTLMLLNVREAITRNFPRRLASVIARVEEEPIRSMLTKQLNDELGNGDPTRTHKILFERFVDGLAEWHPSPITDDHTLPGRMYGEAQEELYTRRSAYEGLGATLIMEVCGKQFDLFLGEQLRRCKENENLPASIIEWLTLHETLEVAHVDESIELAQMAPPGLKARLTARGAEELRLAGWPFLDSMYRLAYG